MLRLIWFWGVLSFGLCAFSSVASFAAPLSSGEVLERLLEARERVQNASFEVRWESLRDGAPEGWERQTFYWDSLGRRRLIYESGSLSADGKPVPSDDPSKTDMLYDGEIVMDRTIYSSRTRDGAARGDEKQSGASREESASTDVVSKSDEDLGYVAVIVGDAQSSLRSSLEAHRNPMDYLQAQVIDELGVAVQRDDATVSRLDDGSYEITYGHAPEQQVGYSKTVVRADPQEGWMASRLESYSQGEQLVRRIEFDYQDQGDGNWVPVKGVHRHWGDRSLDQAPYFEWRFEVERARYNDQSFDESVFKISLEPDTAVSDTRYGVAYRIGTERAVASDLAQLAEQAKLGPEVAPISTGGSMNRKWLLVGNGVLAIAIGVVWVWNRRFAH